jgi:hypothetical protein
VLGLTAGPPKETHDPTSRSQPWDPSSPHLPKEAKLLRAFPAAGRNLGTRRHPTSRRKRSSSEPFQLQCNVPTHRRHTPRRRRDHRGSSYCDATSQPPVDSPPEGNATTNHRSVAIPRRKRVRLQQPTLARPAVRRSRHASAADSPESRMHEHKTTRPSVTPAGCVHLRGGERAGVSKPRSVSTRPRLLASQPPRTRTRQVPFVRHVDVHTSELARTRHRKKRGMQAHLATTMGESCDISCLPWGLVPFDASRSEQRPTLGFHTQLRSAFRFSQPLDALLRSQPLRSCFIPVTPLGCMLSEVSPPR